MLLSVWIGFSSSRVVVDELTVFSCEPDLRLKIDNRIMHVHSTLNSELRINVCIEKTSLMHMHQLYCTVKGEIFVVRYKLCIPSTLLIVERTLTRFIRYACAFKIRVQF